MSLEEILSYQSDDRIREDYADLRKRMKESDAEHVRRGELYANPHLTSLRKQEKIYREVMKERGIE